MKIITNLNDTDDQSFQHIVIQALIQMNVALKMEIRTHDLLVF